MKNSKKQLKAKMNKILNQTFEGHYDTMKDFFFRMTGYALNHPDYLKGKFDAETAWVDMSDIMALEDYLSLSHDLITEDKPKSIIDSVSDKFEHTPYDKIKEVAGIDTESLIINFGILLKYSGSEGLTTKSHNQEWQDHFERSCKKILRILQWVEKINKDQKK